MQQSIYTVVSYDGWQYIYSENPEYHTIYENAYKEFRDAQKFLSVEDPHTVIAIVKFADVNALKNDINGTVVKTCNQWTQTVTRWPVE